MTMINTPLVLLARQCGGTFHTPGVTRAIKGMAFTFEQLEVLAARLRAEGPPPGFALMPVAATQEMCTAMRSFLEYGFSLTENGRRPMSALYADLLAAAPPATAVPVTVPSEADIAAAREHIADVHNAAQMRSALSQLRRDVVVELAARGFIPALDAAAPAAPAVGSTA